METAEVTTAKFIRKLEKFDQGEFVFSDLLYEARYLEEKALLCGTYAPATDNSNDKGLIRIHTIPTELLHFREDTVERKAPSESEYLFTRRHIKRTTVGIVPEVEWSLNWSVFTGSSLAYIADWSNIIAAGGSVQQCLIPSIENSQMSPFSRNRSFRSTLQADSDIDLFIYGLNWAQATRKADELYEAVSLLERYASHILTPFGSTIKLRFPYRTIQIIYTAYSSAVEVLSSFDIDACCCAYDGKFVTVSPRGALALLWQMNTVNMHGRSASYEIRLAKYATRGFKVHVPGLKREAINPKIYETSIYELEGLGRLLVLEKQLMCRRTRHSQGLVLRHFSSLLREFDYLKFLRADNSSLTELADPEDSQAEPQTGAQSATGSMIHLVEWEKSRANAQSAPEIMNLFYGVSTTRIRPQFQDIAAWCRTAYDDIFLDDTPYPSHTSYPATAN